jgi:hypothetical protein
VRLGRSSGPAPADPCLGKGFGITAAAPAPRALGLPDNGAALQRELSSVAVLSVFPGRYATQTATAAEFFDLSANVGGPCQPISLRSPQCISNAGFGLAAGGLPRLGNIRVRTGRFPGSYVAVGSRHACTAAASVS